MPRSPRKLILFDDCVCHKVWRGHNREYNISKEDDRRMYMKFMKDEHERDKNEVALMAMCIMGNHSHELNKIGKVGDYSDYMRRHHSNYGRYFNDKNKRCGGVAQDRPFTACFESERFTMECIHYIHYNPVKKRIVKKAEDYKWSTYRYFAYGEKPSWLEGINFKFPTCYEELGDTPSERQLKYRALFEEYSKQIKSDKEGFKDNEDDTYKNKKVKDTSLPIKKKQIFVGNIFIGNVTWIQSIVNIVRTFFKESTKKNQAPTISSG